MKAKEIVTRQLEQLENRLTMLDSSLSMGRPLYEIKAEIDSIKERIQSIQTLINNE
jgi:hypothetical protein